MAGSLLENVDMSEGNPAVERDFSVVLSQPERMNGSIHLNGNVCRTHGPAEDVLSVIAHRSRDILEAIQETLHTGTETDRFTIAKSSIFV